MRGRRRCDSGPFTGHVDVVVTGIGERHQKDRRKGVPNGDHGIVEVTPELAAKVRGAIRDHEHAHGK